MAIYQKQNIRRNARWLLRPTHFYIRMFFSVSSAFIPGILPSTVTPSIHGLRPTGQPSLFKFIPDEFVGPRKSTRSNLIPSNLSAVSL